MFWLRSDVAYFLYIGYVWSFVKGSLGPMASAFSVCSLAQTWRAEYLSGDNGHGIWKEKDVSDPAW